MNLEKFYTKDSEGYSVIEIGVDNLDELFHSLDHSALHQKDLDPDVEKYIFESVEELGVAKKRIAIYCRNECNINEKNINNDRLKIAETGIKQYFNYRYDYYRGHLKNKIYQAISSIILGTVFLFLYVFFSNLHTKDMTIGVLEEGLLIIGWVALWKPIEILLYDWRVEFNKYKIYNEIVKTKINILLFNNFHEHENNMKG